MQRMSSSESATYFSIEEKEDIKSMLFDFKNEVSKRLNTMFLDLKFVCIQIEKINAILEDGLASSDHHLTSTHSVDKGELQAFYCRLEDCLEKGVKDISNEHMSSVQPKRLSFGLNSKSSSDWHGLNASMWTNVSKLRRYSINENYSDTSNNKYNLKTIMKYISMDDPSNKVYVTVLCIYGHTFKDSYHPVTLKHNLALFKHFSEVTLHIFFLFTYVSL